MTTATELAVARPTAFGTLPVAAAVLCMAAAQTLGQAQRQIPPLRHVADFEAGKLYRAGKICVVELQGSYRQMGRQYGSLMKREMGELYDVAVRKAFPEELHLEHDEVVTISKTVFDVYPQRYKELLYGMAETSGLTREQQLILNASELMPLFHNMVYNCSAIAAWGEYTSNGPLVIGRNNDDAPLLKKYARHLTVTILKGDGSSIPAAIINYAGVMYAPTGMNQAGLFLELNAGNWGYFYETRLNILVDLMSFLQEFSSMKQLAAALNSTRPNFSVIITAADRGVAYAVECPTHGFKRRAGAHEGLVVATNHYVDPAWDMARVKDRFVAQTVERRRNLLSLGERYKGQFSPETMMRVMDTTIDKRGATVPGTVYQVVAVPKELRLWLKVPGFQDWTGVDLEPLFGGK